MEINDQVAPPAAVSANDIEKGRPEVYGGIVFHAIMRIAFLVRHFPALSETFVLNQITGLLERGHEVDIFAEAPHEALVHPDIKRYGLASRTHYWPAVPARKSIRWLKGLGLLACETVLRPRVATVVGNVPGYGRQSLNMKLAYAAWPVLNGRRYDVIHCHFGPIGIRGLALHEMRLLEGKLVTSFYGFDLSADVKKSPRLYSRLLHHGDFFLAVSENFRQRLLKLGCVSTKVAVHRMGIDCSRFILRSRGPAADGVIRLASVARLVEKKGIEYAIRAVAELTAAGQRILYTIVGEGPLASKLARVVSELGLGDTVRLVGEKSQPDVINILNDAHLFVAPSVVSQNGDEEGTPAVIMEAMAVGLPVIATRHSGIPEMIEDGVSGMLVAERDVRALTSAIAELADHPERWPAFGRAGRDRVLSQHNSDTLNDSLVSLYEGLAS